MIAHALPSKVYRSMAPCEEFNKALNTIKRRQRRDAFDTIDKICPAICIQLVAPATQKKIVNNQELQNLLISSTKLPQTATFRG